MQDDDYTMVKSLKARIEALEQAGKHYSNPDDRRLDNLLRKIARSVEMTAWLGGMCIKIAPIIAVIWWFGDEGIKWMGSWLWPGK